MIVVDPQRDVSAYLADAAGHGMRIEKVVETHFHADFDAWRLGRAAQNAGTTTVGPVRG